MSDWEEEETGRGFDGGKPAEGQKVSGWSDDEGIGEQIGRGGTQGGGGGDRGGYRRGGGNSGGYSNRRDDDNATEIPPIPSSFNKDVVEDFINRLDLGKHIVSLADARVLRDYYFTAFRDLISSEYVRLEALDQEGRVRKGQQIREAAVLMDSFISDVNTLLGESEVMEAEDNVVVQLKQMGINWEQNGPNLDTVVPQTTSETVSTGRTIRVVPQTTSQTCGTIRAAQCRKWKRNEQVAIPAPHDVKPIIDIYKMARRLYNEQESGFGATISEEDYEEVAISESYGTSRFRQSVSAGLLNLHKMRPVKFGCMSDLVDTPWPIVPTAWLCYPRFYHVVRHFNEVPQKEKRAPDNSSSIQTSSHMDLVVRHHRSQIGNMDTPDGAYFSRYDATRDEENALSANSGGITVGGVATEHTSSTPLRRHELGMSLTNLNFSMINERRSVSLQAPPDPPMPFGSMNSSGTLMLTVDNEETAIIEPAATSTQVRPIRLVSGGTPGSTPHLNFRPLLPAINEEQQHHNQPLQDEQLIAAIPRVLQMTMSPPSQVVEEALVPVNGSNTQNRDWASIFRPRDQITNYLEEAATPLRNAARRRRPRHHHHRTRVPDVVANNIETPQERNPGELNVEVEQVVATTSSKDVTTSFMANLLQHTAPDPTPEKVQKPLADAQEMNDITTLEQITDINTTMDILNSPKINIEQSLHNQTTVELMEIDNQPAVAQEDPSISTSLANLSVSAIVTDVQILSASSASNLLKDVVDWPAVAAANVSLKDNSLYNGESTASNLLKDVVDCPVVAAEENSLYNNESLEDMGYIVQHSDQLRLMIDHQMELSVEQQLQRSLNGEQRDESSSDSHSSMAGVKVYDPQMIINMPESKIRLAHGLIGALIAQQQVDLQNASFVKNRMDAAIAFRILLDLKAANMINLSPDGRFSSLK